MRLFVGEQVEWKYIGSSRGFLWLCVCGDQLCVPGVAAVSDQVKLSISDTESYQPSPVSQMTKRSSIVSPGLTFPAVVSHPVPPPAKLLFPHQPGSPGN